MSTQVRFDPNHPYLGPARWPSWIRKMLPYWRLFNYAAHLHDLFFAKGGSVEDMERANRIFSVMVRAAAKTRMQKRFAGFYSYMVSEYGKDYFNHAG